MLSEEQIAFYRKNGYLRLDRFIHGEQLARLQRAGDEMVEASKLHEEGDDGYGFEPGHSAETPMPRRISRSRLTDPIFEQLNTDPRVLGVATSLIGPNIRTSLAAINNDPTDKRLYGLKLNIKWPGFGTPFEWHQDWAFLPHTNDDLLVFAIMIDDVGEDSGPLQVIPGSHRGEIHNHHNNGYFCGGIDPTRCSIDFSKAVALTGEAGSVHIHHTRMVHGSSVNTSGKLRRIFFIDYAAADAWPLVGVSDLDRFNARMIQGEPTTMPRLAPVPVRMPLPARVAGAAIFAQQEGLSHRYFECAAGSADRNTEGQT